MKEIRVPLSVNNLKELTKKIKTFQADIKNAEKGIVKDLIDIADKEIREGYATSPYEGYEESNSFSKTKNKASVSGQMYFIENLEQVQKVQKTLTL